MTVTNIPRRAVLARLQTPADYARQVHFYCALSGDTLEQMALTRYFNSLAPRLRRYDRIEVVSDDDTFFAEFLVLESSSAGVRVMPARAATLDSPLSPPGAALRAPGDLRVENRGPFLQWCVVRG